MITLSVDDGCSSDLRIAQLAKRYGIKCTFYLPVNWHLLARTTGYEPLSWFDALSIASEHTIGSHGITHGHLTKMSYEDAEDEIIQSKLMLERLFNVDIKKFCPSRGYITPELTKRALQFYDSVRLTKGSGLVHVHPDSGANGNIHWLEYYNKIKDDHETIEIWGHSHEWDRFNMWDEIEEFLRERIK